MKVFTVPDTLSVQRIDKLLSEMYPEWSRSFIQKMIDDGRVTVNGKTVTKSSKISGGCEVTVEEIELREIVAQPQNIPLDIRYEDKDLLVVNKPRGMVVHPAPGNPDGTLVNALLYYCKGELSGINGEIRPGIVHRIDKDTSGLLIVAKNDTAHKVLAAQIEEHSFLREYRAVLHGRFKEPCGTVNAPIGRSEKDRKKMCVTDKNSRHAITHYEVLETFDSFSYTALRLETGRTHQIRVHMSYIGHPVAGDPVYGPRNTALDGGQCLHAGLIGFRHPADGRYIEISSQLPEYFEKFLRKLRP